MEFANDPEINCVFCGLGFSSVENVELHIVNNHQSNNVEHLENRKSLITNEEKNSSASTQHLSSIRTNDEHSLNNGFKAADLKNNCKHVKHPKIKCHIQINQRKYLAGDALKQTGHDLLSDITADQLLERRPSRPLLKHRCHRCLKRFLYRSTLLIHLHNHQYETKYQFKCDKCGFKYSTKDVLLRHSVRGCVISFHSEIETKQPLTSSGICHYCHTTFTSSTYLAMHKRRVCRYINNDNQHYRLLTDDTKDQLMSHDVTETKCDRISSSDSKSKENSIKEDLIEPHSSEMFSVQSSQFSGDHKYQSSSPELSLKDSVSPMAPESDNAHKQEPNDQSGADNDNSQSYLWHECNGKNRKRPFQCEICKKHFSNRSSLSNHIKSHYSSRGQPFICRDCNQRFVNLISLQDHRREICSKQSPTITESKSPVEEDQKCKSKPVYSLSNFNGVSQVPLWPNNNQSTPVSQPVTCVHCSGVFYDRLELEEHALVKHSDDHGNILCLLCERTFTTNMALRVHLTKSHGFANGGCPGVSQNLPPMPRLDTNYNISDEIPHRKRRRRLFEYEKEYTCENCNRNFSTGQALGNHRRACMNMPSDVTSTDTKPNSGSHTSKLHSIESLIFDNKNIRSTPFNDDKNVFLAFH